MATSTPYQQVGHSICYVGVFYYWVDGKDQNKIYFLILGFDLRAKSI